MAKKQDDSIGDNDYIEQLQWQASFRRRWPIRFTPKWKYKIIYNDEKTGPGATIAAWAMLICVASIVIFTLSSFVRSGEIGKAIAFGVLFGMIGIILHFAARDISKEQEDDHENFEE